MRSETRLVLGPLLRYVGETSATIWVQTAGRATVTIRCADRSWSAGTFAAHGHHYALIVLDGLPRAGTFRYRVDVDDEQVWPSADGEFPPSVIRTIDSDRPMRIAFGSCRTSVPHDKQGTRHHGVDAMRAYALDMAARPDDPDRPELMVFLGDQVYADDTSEAMRAFIERRRGLQEPPGTELKDYVEYAELYRLAWSDPANQWLLSTLPTAMIFDDHDVRDDWNTSQSWHRAMNATPWWHQRIVGALASYWVYQHAGNLAPEELARDEIWQLIEDHRRSGAADELDLTEPLRVFAERVDADAESYRWSHLRELGDSRLIVIDSRAARDLRPAHRSMLNAEELRWLDEQLRGDVEHLFIGTSLPFLMPPGLHFLEAIDEAMAEGAWGRRPAGVGEKFRQSFDLEHWAAFQRSFAEVLEMVMQVARGERGSAPRTITFLSGDVHNSYLTQVDKGRYGTLSTISQAVCSPIRNPLPKPMRVLTSLLARGLARPLRWAAGRSAKVPDSPYEWRVTHGPWFDNNLAVVQVLDDGLRFTWDAGEITDGAYDRPDLRRVSEIVIH